MDNHADISDLGICHVFQSSELLRTEAMKKKQTYKGDWLLIGIGILFVVFLYAYGYSHFAH